MAGYHCNFKKIEEAIERGIDFLYQNQLDYGEFKTLASWNPWFLGNYFDSNPFATALILYSIKDIKNEKVKAMTEKAIDFLLSEKEPGGVWRFWTSRNKKRLPADLDNISAISFILKLNKVSFDDNLQLILNNRNEENLFLTWLIDEKDKKKVSWWVDKIYKIFEVAKKDVDGIVNANVLLYLGKNDSPVCSYLNQIIKSNQPFSFHYPNKLVFFYMVSRAFRNNISGLEKSQDIIIKSSLSLQKKNGSFGHDLDTALALNTLFNFNYREKEINLGINYLLKKQLAQGSWEKAVLFVGPFPYRYYGSQELTTAFCLEALNNYLQKNEIKN